ncbi:GNAT family N-acetyltransferase [Bdellovibrio sp. HCB274]|uniref:GNAT family N-acetyltransferase n=1 Tax=Bdellovibrio sp. HCB274 TaxID=3394361 RepID=UPI0039B537FA
MNKFDLVKQTESMIQGLYDPPRGTRPGAVAMWKDISSGDGHPKLKLHEVRSTSDFMELYDLRLSYEAYSEDYSKEAQESLDFARHCQNILDAKWYLLEAAPEDFVGEIGLIPFDFGGVKIGRLQNVEIHPDQKGNGFGNELLTLVEFEARKLGLQALCLKARPDDWPATWYKKKGFEIVGTW